MSEWTDGYRAAVRDLRQMATGRGLMTDPLDLLFGDFEQDALVIEHEVGNRLQKRRLVAAREALPLFVAAGRSR